MPPEAQDHAPSVIVPVRGLRLTPVGNGQQAIRAWRHPRSGSLEHLLVGEVESQAQRSPAGKPVYEPGHGVGAALKQRLERVSLRDWAAQRAKFASPGVL